MPSSPRADTSDPRPRRTTRRALAGVGLTAALLLAAACGDDAASTTSTTGADAAETTTSTASDDGSGEVSEDELEALLPQASDIGPGYAVVETSEEEDGGNEATQAALEEACPEASEFFADEEDEDDKLEREFSGEQDRSVTVGLDPTPRNLEEDTLDAVIAAINSCTSASLTQDGFDMTLDLAAERDDTYGERGAQLDMQVTMAHPQLPEPLTLDFRMRVFVVDSVSATIEVTSGVDEQTLTPVPGDFDLLDSLAPDLEADLRDLAD